MTNCIKFSYMEESIITEFSIYNPGNLFQYSESVSISAV